MTFTLNIAISESDVSRIWNTGQAVTLVKATFGEIGLRAIPTKAIVWVAFKPFQSNQVSWDATGSVYATTSPLENGCWIAVNAQCEEPAQIGYAYTFKEGIFSTAPRPGPYIYIENQIASPAFSFGLVQQASVNSAAVAEAVNALPVLFNQEAYFAPTNNVWVFLSGCQSGGTVLEQVPGNALEVQLTEQSPVANLGYNGSAFFLNG